VVVLLSRQTPSGHKNLLLRHDPLQGRLLLMQAFTHSCWPLGHVGVPHLVPSQVIDPPVGAVHLRQLGPQASRASSGLQAPPHRR
jgi:hypothetical protein